MPSLNPLLVLLAVALAMYVLIKLARLITPNGNQPKKLQQLESNSASRHESTTSWNAQQTAQNTAQSAVGGADQANKDITPLFEQNIHIDADQPTESRAIEPDLAAALEQADAEIKLAEDHAATASKNSDVVLANDHPLSSNIVLLEPRNDQQTESKKDTAYGPNVSISDAELIEPVSDSHGIQPVISEPVKSASSPLESTKLYAKNPATGDASNENAVTAVSRDNEVIVTTTSNTETGDTASEAAPLPSDLTTLQVESNSAQLMLIDSYTDIIIANENLSQSIQRISKQSSVNRLARSKINAEQQRKLILANARAEKQRTHIDSEKKSRIAGEKLIGKQQSEIERINAQITNMKQTLLLKQSELEKQQLQLARSQMMASSAAKLARRAAITQQQAKDAAETEKKLRHKVEGRTQQAISIAKNAITALAEEEKKNRVDSVIN